MCSVAKVFEGSLPRLFQDVAHFLQVLLDRIPSAALCGVLGLKPTYGRVSRFGLIAFASSFDQIGPITRTARDAADVLAIIAGHDPQDATSVDAPVPDYRAALTGDLRGSMLRHQPDRYL